MTRRDSPILYWLLRIILRMMALLVLGAVTATLIAWAFAMIAPEVTQFDSPNSGARLTGNHVTTASWQDSFGRSAGAIWGVIHRDEYPHAVSGRIPGWIPSGPWEERRDITEVFSYGAPFRCLVRMKALRIGSISDLPNGELNISLGGKAYVLPMLPYWPGMVANSLFFGAIWLILFAAARSIRRRSRRSRALCVRCAYSVRGIKESCPECGHPVPRVNGW